MRAHVPGFQPFFRLFLLTQFKPPTPEGLNAIWAYDTYEDNFGIEHEFTFLRRVLFPVLINISPSNIF